MAIYIALLRGINVSGQKIISMVDLKEMFVKLGFKDAKTFIQSGNVVFTGKSNDIDEFIIGKEAVYILVRGGYGKSQFSNNFVEKKLSVRATSRNLESSRKLVALADTF